MIDAAGAIYVIGGLGSTGFYNDVWASTDGGADRTHAGALEGVLGGYSGILPGYSGGARGDFVRCSVVPRGTKRDTL